MDVVSDAARRKHLDAAVLVDEDVPDVVVGDAGRLRQILVNFIGNGIKFTTAGSVHVHVSRVAMASNLTTLRFACIDTGIGIDTASQAALFTPFTQAEASTTRRFGGTGLGLAISKQIVQSMHGDCGVESVRGSGSTFWFTATFGLESSVPRQPFVSPQEQSVLCVTSSPLVSASLGTLLSRWFVRHTCANEAGVAIQTLASRGDIGAMSQVVLLDESLGSEAIAAVRAAMPPGASGLLLCSTLVGAGEKARQAGLVGAITKPVRQRSLADALSRVLGVQVGPPHVQVTRDSTTQLRSLRVLLAEDNVVNQRIASQMLKKLGHLVDVAANGLEAVSAIDRGEYDIVLMDCQMPECDGFEATTLIRARAGKQPAVIALTASAMTEDRQDCIQAGMDDFLSKPLRIDELQAALSRWSDGRTPVVASHRAAS